MFWYMSYIILVYVISFFVICHILFWYIPYILNVLNLKPWAQYLLSVKCYAIVTFSFIFFSLFLSLGQSPHLVNIIN